MNFILAVAYQFCLSLPKKFSQLQLHAEPCTSIDTYQVHILNWYPCAVVGTKKSHIHKLILRIDSHRLGRPKGVSLELTPHQNVGDSTHTHKPRVLLDMCAHVAVGTILDFLHFMFTNFHQRFSNTC